MKTIMGLVFVVLFWHPCPGAEMAKDSASAHRFQKIMYCYGGYYQTWKQHTLGHLHTIWQGVTEDSIPAINTLVVTLSQNTDHKTLARIMDDVHARVNVREGLTSDPERMMRLIIGSFYYIPPGKRVDTQFIDFDVGNQPHDDEPHADAIKTFVKQLVQKEIDLGYPIIEGWIIGEEPYIWNDNGKDLQCWNRIYQIIKEAENETDLHVSGLLDRSTGIMQEGRWHHRIYYGDNNLPQAAFVTGRLEYYRNGDRFNFREEGYTHPYTFWNADAAYVWYYNTEKRMDAFVKSITQARTDVLDSDRVKSLIVGVPTHHSDGNNSNSRDYPDRFDLNVILDRAMQVAPNGILCYGWDFHRQPARMNWVDGERWSEVFESLQSPKSTTDVASTPQPASTGPGETPVQSLNSVKRPEPGVVQGYFYFTNKRGRRIEKPLTVKIIQPIKRKSVLVIGDSRRTLKSIPLTGRMTFLSKGRFFNDGYDYVCIAGENKKNHFIISVAMDLREKEFRRICETDKGSESYRILEMTTGLFQANHIGRETLILLVRDDHEGVHRIFYKDVRDKQIDWGTEVFCSDRKATITGLTVQDIDSDGYDELMFRIGDDRLMTRLERLNDPRFKSY